ncbi:Methylamine utilisation protein MauE [Thermomonospora echinospora]|uniref:Methylamine utilisation protein MauE n=2 Tax=Thermomonospora echinospora TaxID=1992 RepID=A0A1H6DKB4_9ACTN|nr:Methylamine utilisation protein MauE [Thermomonospora echinospora]
MRDFLALAVQGVVAGVFALAVLGKLRGRDGFGRFATTVGRLTMRPGRPAVVIAAVVTAVEVVTTVLVAVPATARAGCWAASGLLVLFVAVVFRAVRGRVFAECGCFGGRGSVMSYPLLLRNLLLLALALTGAALAPADPPHPVPVHGAALVLGLAAAAVFLRSYDRLTAVVLTRLDPWAGT